jgi:uncharacterized membrane protein YphA (DoxX/SURF4 family)
MMSVSVGKVLVTLLVLIGLRIAVASLPYSGMVLFYFFWLIFKKIFDRKRTFDTIPDC